MQIVYAARSRASDWPEQYAFQYHAMVESNDSAVRSSYKRGDWTGFTNECKCLRRDSIGLSQGSAFDSQPYHGYFGNTLRVFSLTRFPHLSMEGTPSVVGIRDENWKATAPVPQT